MSDSKRLKWQCDVMKSNANIYAATSKQQSKRIGKQMNKDGTKLWTEAAVVYINSNKYEIKEVD